MSPIVSYSVCVRYALRYRLPALCAGVRLFGDIEIERLDRDEGFIVKVWNVVVGVGKVDRSMIRPVGSIVFGMFLFRMLDGKAESYDHSCRHEGACSSFVNRSIFSSGFQDHGADGFEFG